MVISVTMLGAMGLIMLFVMWPMFENKRLNVALLGTFVVILIGAFALARTETFVGDKGILYSMIPHHSRAILVCQEAQLSRPEAQLSGPEVVALCDQIVRSQQEEISQMKAFDGEVLDLYYTDFVTQ